MLHALLMFIVCTCIYIYIYIIYHCFSSVAFRSREHLASSSGPRGSGRRGNSAGCLGAKDRTPEIDTSESIVDFQWDFPTEFHFSAVRSKGLSLFQWIVTGIVQWIFSVTLKWNLTFLTKYGQWNLTFVTSGV